MTTCWAECLGDCDAQQSREHLVTGGLFGDSVIVQGFPWQQAGEVKTIGIQGLTSKVLCRRHNSALSPLDQAAIDFRDVVGESMRIRNVRLEATPRKWPGHRVQANGLSFERWCLKTMCSMITSGNVQAHAGWNPSTALVEFIFGRSHLPENCGLAVVAEIGNNVNFSGEHIRFAPINATHDGQLGAVSIEFCGLRWLCSWDIPVLSIAARQHDTTEVYRGAIYHLKAIHMRDTNNAIEWSWDGALDREGAGTLAEVRRQLASTRVAPANLR